MYLYLKNIHPATAIDHCVKAHFTSETDLNLVVVKANVLEVYIVTKEPEMPLVLYKHYELHSAVADVATVRFAQHATDCLVLAFAEAKVSVVCFDQSMDDLHTISVHYLEDDFLTEERQKNTPLNMQLKLEPNSRYPVMFAICCLVTGSLVPPCHHVLPWKISLGHCPHMPFYGLTQRFYPACFYPKQLCLACLVRKV